MTADQRTAPPSRCITLVAMSDVPPAEITGEVRVVLPDLDLADLLDPTDESEED